MVGLSIIGIIYGAIVSFAQTDVKRLVAYSSVSHLGFVMLGLFALNMQGIEGGIVQMISHGFISGALFLCVGVLYDRMHSRDISSYGGVVNTMPVFASFMLLFAMANAGLPGTSGFVGEFMVILASFKANFWFAFLAATTLILGAAYSLWMVKRVVFGDIANDKVKDLEDVNAREFVILASLAVMVLFFGLYPAPLVDVMHASIDNLLAHVTVSKLPTETGIVLLGTGN